MTPELTQPATRADLHCHSTASQLSKLGVQRSRSTGVRHATGGCPRTGDPPRDGLRDHHRPRHDRRRAADRRRPPGLPLGGADGFVQGRAAGGARPLLRHHSRRPRMAAGPLADVEACADYLRERRSRARSRTRSTRWRRRAAAPAPPGRAVRGLGDPQRLPCPRAERSRRDLRRDPRQDRDRRLRRPRRRRHRAHVHRGPRLRDPRRVPRPRARGPGRAAGSRAARPSGRTRRSPSRSAAPRPAGGDRPPRRRTRSSSCSSASSARAATAPVPRAERFAATDARAAVATGSTRLVCRAALS